VDAPPTTQRRTSRTKLVVLGLLTFWPPVYMVLFVAVIVGMMFLVPSGGEGNPWPFVLIFPLHLLTMLEMFGLTVYYAVDVYRDPSLQGDRKVLWMVIVLLGGFIGQAIYYVLWLVKRNPAVLGAGSDHAAAAGSAPPVVDESASPTAG